MLGPVNTFLISAKKFSRNFFGQRESAAHGLRQASISGRNKQKLLDNGRKAIEDEVGTSGAKNLVYRRYLSDKPLEKEAYLRAACDYVAKKRSDEVSWLHCKPYESSPGNTAFYTEMYQCLNVVRAMNIPHRGKILEVGSGPGWITEILVALGFEVHGLDPSADMIAIAHERVSSAIKHWRVQNPPHFDFHCQTLEDCTLPADEYDAVLFHASLHHVIDEDAGLAQCFRVLRPGGVLGVCEGAWEPGNTSLEAALDEEMVRFGTLENPFTREYLDYLLTKHGFTSIQRYHSINGFVPEQFGSATVELLADMPACSSNNLTALKPNLLAPTTRDHSARSSATITVLEVKWTSSRKALSICLRLTNTGETTWLHKAYPTGQVTIAFRSDPLGAANYEELERHNLPNDVEPGQNVTLDLELVLPEGGNQRTWSIDMVNEGLFWFSTRGTKAVLLPLPRY